MPSIRRYRAIVAHPGTTTKMCATPLCSFCKNEVYEYGASWPLIAYPFNSETAIPATIFVCTSCARKYLPKIMSECVEGACDEAVDKIWNDASDHFDRYVGSVK